MVSGFQTPLTSCSKLEIRPPPAPEIAEIYGKFPLTATATMPLLPGKLMTPGAKCGTKPQTQKDLIQPFMQTRLEKRPQNLRGRDTQQEPQVYL